MLKRRILGSSPAKLILFGEHAVVSPYNKTGVATTLSDFRTFTTTNLRPDSPYVFQCVSTMKNFSPFCLLDIEGFDELTKKIDVSSSDFAFHQYDEDIFNEVENYLQNYSQNKINTINKCITYMLAVFANIFPFFSDKIAYEFLIDSYVPSGAGLGSSASLSISVAQTVIIQLFNEYVEIISKHNENESVEKKLSILDAVKNWSLVFEKIFHGNPSGIDNFVCMKGGIVAFQKGNVEIIPIEDSIFPSNLQTLIVNSNVKRSTKKIVSNVRKEWEKDPKRVNSLFEGIDECSNDFIKLCKGNEYLEKNKEMKDDFFFDRFNELIEKNQFYLDDLESVCHPAIAEIIEVLENYDLSGKLTGAGGGGCVYSPFPFHKDGNENVKEVVEVLEDLGYSCSISCDLAGKGSSGKIIESGNSFVDDKGIRYKKFEKSQ